MKHLLPPSYSDDKPRQATPRTASTGRFPWWPALGLMFMLVFLIWQVAIWTERYELRQLHNQANHELTLNIANLRGKLDKYEYLPELLATKQELSDYLLNITPLSTLRLNSMLKTYQQITRVSDIYLLNQDGTTVAASNWQSPRSFLGKNFSFRPYYKDAIQGQKGRFYGLGTTSGERGYYYSYPVFSGQGISGVLVVKIVIDDLEIPWQDPDTEFVVSDPDNVVFISSKKDWLLRSLYPLSVKELERIYNSRRYGTQPIRSLTYQHMEEIDPDTWLVRIAPDTPEQASRVSRYLQTSLPMSDAGWQVHILKNTRKVRTEILKNSMLTAGIYLLVVLLSMYSMQRQRIQRERLRHDRETQKALEANEARIRAILDNTQAGIITMNPAGIINYINPSAERLFGYQLHELHGRYFHELICHTDREMCSRALKQAQDQPVEIQPVEIKGLNNNALSVPMEILVSQMHRGEQTQLMVTLHDITERKQHEEALQSAYDQMENRVIERTQDLTEANDRLKKEIAQHRNTTRTLQQTQDELIQAAKLAVLGQMSASINHELNQPIAAIRAYAENGVTFLERENAHMAQLNLEQIVELTDRMASISAQLKLFARKTEGELSLISPRATIDYALRLFRPQLDKGQIAFHLHQPEQDLYVKADAVRLEQVLVNLISNALHAVESQPIREVSVTLSPHTVEQASGVADQLWIEVADSGPGISENHISQIFNPFFSTRDEGKGLGLGLSISYRIITDFGGTIKAFNRPEGGAILRVILPLAKAEPY